MRSPVLAVVVASLFAMAAGGAAAGEPSPPESATVASAPVTYDGRARELEVPVPRLAATIEIDGHLSEPVWAQAAVLGGFSRYAPVDGEAADAPTEVLVWYSPTAIHFGIRAEAPAGDVRATLADRDHITNDDHVLIFLDTFNDGRQALVFGVNPLGQSAGASMPTSQSAARSIRTSRRLNPTPGRSSSIRGRRSSFPRSGRSSSTRSSSSRRRTT